MKRIDWPLHWQVEKEKFSTWADMFSQYAHATYIAPGPDKLRSLEVESGHKILK